MTPLHKILGIFDYFFLSAFVKLRVWENLPKILQSIKTDWFCFGFVCLFVLILLFNQHYSFLKWFKNLTKLRHTKMLHKLSGGHFKSLQCVLGPHMRDQREKGSVFFFFFFFFFLVLFCFCFCFCLSESCSIKKLLFSRKMVVFLLFHFKFNPAYTALVFRKKSSLGSLKGVTFCCKTVLNSWFNRIRHLFLNSGPGESLLEFIVTQVYIL